MGPAIAALLGALLGGSASIVASLIAVRGSDRREHQDRQYQAKSEVYLDLLAHFEELRSTSFSDSVAFSAYSDKSEALLLENLSPWFLKMEIYAPRTVRDQANTVVDKLRALGEAREYYFSSHFDRESNTGPPSTQIELSPKVRAAHRELDAAREILVDLIRSDLGLDRISEQRR